MEADALEGFSPPEMSTVDLQGRVKSRCQDDLKCYQVIVVALHSYLGWM